MLLFDYFLLSLKSLPPYYPGCHPQTPDRSSLIMQSDLVLLLNLSFLFMPSKLYFAQQKYFMVETCCFPSSSQWCWWLGWGEFHPPEYFLVWQQRSTQLQMSIVLRLRNPGVQKCLPSFWGLFSFTWMMQFWWHRGTYSLTNVESLARLNLILEP